MIKKTGRTIQWQKTREFITKKKYSGESSPYWEYINNALVNYREHDQDNSEYPTANPDVLINSEPNETPEIDTREIMQEVLKEARFSKQERDVLNYAGLQGFTEEKTAEILGISRRAVRTCLSRAKKKCRKLFAAISARRVYITQDL